MEHIRYHVNYEQILINATPDELDSIIRKMSEQLPHDWVDAYRLANRTHANVLRIKHDGFEYLFDHSSELVLRGEVAKEYAVEDRIVAVHGCSRPPGERRRDGLMRKHPLGPIDFIRAHSDISRGTVGTYDKGHFIGHSLGGTLHLNLFPQATQINRGWSEEGKLYRRMERYCEKHPGTYCFSRPIYAGFSAHPKIIEFGVLKTDGKLWLAEFSNCDSSEEMATIERLFRAKIAGADDDGLRSIL
jgi:hypothetical protein